MSNDFKFALQSGFYGCLRIACIHSAHFQGLDLLKRFCLANDMPEQAGIFSMCGELLAQAAPEFSSVSKSMHESFLARSNRDAPGFDDRRLAISSAAKSLRMPTETLAARIDLLREKTTRHYYSYIDFDPQFIKKNEPARADESTLRRAVASASALSRLRECFPKLARAVHDMREAPLDWGADGAFALAMADRLRLLSPKFPAGCSDSIEFLCPAEIMSGVQQPWFALATDAPDGTARLLSEGAKPGKPRAYTRELSSSLRFASATHAEQAAAKHGISSYAVVEFTCAARHARPCNESGVNYATLETLERAKLACAHADAAFDKRSIERALDGRPPLAEEFPGLELGLCAGALGGLIAPNGETFYTPFKAILASDPLRLAARLPRRKAPTGMILIDYELCDAKIVSARRLRRSSALAKLKKANVAALSGSAALKHQSARL